MKGDFLGHLWCRECNTIVVDYVHSFGGPKSLQWGGMIQVAMEKLKNESPQIEVQLGPDHSVRHPNSNDVNDTKIHICMLKL